MRPVFERPARTGTIHSVFRQAINIALDDTVVTLLGGKLPRMPNSVKLPSAVVEGLMLCLRPGMDVCAGSGRLLIPDCDFSLHLPETAPWEPRPEMAACHWHRETVAQHTRLLAHYLIDQHQQEGLAPLLGPLLLGQQVQETPLTSMALPKLRMLVQAGWQRDNTGIEEATRGLAGLGPGLTPAGDDVLGGFAAVMVLLSSHLSADSAPRDHIAASIAAVARPRTTKLSSVLLAHAACGEVAEHLGKMLLALALPTEKWAGASLVSTFRTCSRNPAWGAGIPIYRGTDPCGHPAVLRAADQLLAFGSTSGRDTLLGVLLGLRALEGEFGSDLHRQ
jgi:hypothetical protein